MMKLINRIRKSANHARFAHRFLRDREGVAAVEFALIAPLLILLFLGTVETSYGVSIDRKISRTASVIADLVTQQEELTVAELKDMMDIAKNIMSPYEKLPCIVITGIKIDNGLSLVEWSYDNKSDATASGQSCTAGLNPNDKARTARIKFTPYPVPDAIKIDGTFLVAAEISAEHDPIVGFFDINGSDVDSSPITLGDEIMLRPRIGTEVKVK